MILKVAMGVTIGILAAWMALGMLGNWSEHQQWRATCERTGGIWHETGGDRAFYGGEVGPWCQLRAR